MPAKLKLISPSVLLFHCPGCEYDHPFHIAPQSRLPPHNPLWEWNGSMDLPTFTPSLLVNRAFPDKRCHSFVTAGRIQFLEDCFHHLKGQTVDLPDWETGDEEMQRKFKDKYF